MSVSALLVVEGGRDERDVDDLELVADGLVLRAIDADLLVKVAEADPSSAARNTTTGQPYDLVKAD
ncbi:hypothetical protein ABZX85_36005 [Streptomyces sp. NPDC004539]|uniref:hypothetical protein n=1 Tax=Streptomyces sp. NPDC004539 TaxID=3154280 RepID=UPI0033AD84E6